MKKIFLIIPFIFILNCSFNKVINHHGVQYLDKKHKNLRIKGTYSTGLRNPSLYELYGTDSVGYSGNSNLKPEKLFS